MTYLSKVLDVGGMAKVEGDLGMLRRTLTFPVRDIQGEIEHRELFYEDDTGFYIPRALVSEYYPLNREPIPAKLSFHHRQKLYPEQKDSVDKVIEQLGKRRGGILQADTGTGKTVMALYIMCQFKRKTLIIVPMVNLMKQWKEAIKKFTMIKKDSQIGIIQGNRMDYKGKSVVIAMIHTLAQKDVSKLKDEFDLTIYDEGHTLGAKTFSTVCPKFNDDFRLMLSATPRRKDGADKVFKYHIGEKLSICKAKNMKPIVYAITYSNKMMFDKRFMWNGKISYGKLWNFISKDEHRNQLLLSMLVRAYHKDRNILIISDRILQLRTLAKKALDNIPSKDVGFVFENYKEFDRKVIFATYGAFGMGVDVPRLDTLIIGTPRSDAEQSIGRVLRHKEDKKTPIIVDVVDISSKTCNKWFKNRKKLYESMDAQIKTS